jgi:hypothetical protein
MRLELAPNRCRAAALADGALVLLEARPHAGPHSRCMHGQRTRRAALYALWPACCTW